MQVHKIEEGGGRYSRAAGVEGSRTAKRGFHLQ